MKKKLKLLGLSLISLVVVVGAVVYFSFFTNFWQYYPNPFRAQTAFSRLEMSAISNPVCHQECFSQRQLYQEAISSYAVKNNSLREQIKNSILSPKTDYRFKAELVSVLKKIAEKEKQQNQADKIVIPDFLFSYLNDFEAERAVKERILTEFASPNDNRLMQYLYSKAADKKLSDDDRGQTINVLGNIGNADTVDFLMKIIMDKTNSDSLRYIAAWKLPGLIGYHNIKLRQEVVDQAAKIVLDKKENVYIRDAMLSVIHDYDDVNKDYVIQIVKPIYHTADNKYIKDSAADILNSLTKTNKYKNPKISGKEWDKQWNDTDKLLAPLFQDVKDMANQNKN